MSRQIAFNLATAAFVTALSATSALGQKMYWTDTFTGKVQRANLDGSDIEDLFVSTQVGPRGIALDLAALKVYWTDSGLDVIQRANLDGSDPETLLAVGPEPRGIALDLQGGHMYWTDRIVNTIQRANLDGTGVELLISTGLVDPFEIVLDIPAGHMYWVDGGIDGVAGKIQRANLDGSNIVDLVVFASTGPIGLALDVASSHMYWTDYRLNRIRRANLDGSNIVELVTSGLNDPFGLALDIALQKMYWTDSGTQKIQRANLDGSNIEDLVISGLDNPREIAIVSCSSADSDCQPNGVGDKCDFANGTSSDCNLNGVPDECDVAGGTSDDCTANNIPDECEPDCNSNGVADSCDIADGTSDDCSGVGNGVPDECEPDCNSNGGADSCDIADATSDDCNFNAVPDECEPDCNGNGIADSCDIRDGTSLDCIVFNSDSGNGVPDECDLVDGTSDDCNSNGIPDFCEIDCNGNGVADSCDIADGTSDDCNSNSAPDECELDCNGNGIADTCDIAVGTSMDCNGNDVPDECADVECISAGVPGECPETDCNGNGVPDACDLADGVALGCAVLEFAPTGSTGPFTIRGNRLFIPAGGVQVEFEILISGWGQTTGNPTLEAYQASMLRNSLLGANASPRSPGVDLSPPSSRACDSAADCPIPLPPPVTQTGGCGTFGKVFRSSDLACDDFQAGFIIDRVCSDDFIAPCRQQSDCPVGSFCVDNPDFVMSGTGDVITAVAGLAMGRRIEWLGASTVGAKQDDGVSRYYAGTLRLIVPAKATGTYTIRFVTRNNEGTILVDGNAEEISALAIIDGQLTIGEACCFPGKTCTILLADACITAGGTPVVGTCDGDIDNDGVADACDPCPGDNPDDADGDGDGIPNCIDQCPGVDDAVFAPECAEAIPAVSQWGVAVMALLLLVGGKIHHRRS